MSQVAVFLKQGMRVVANLYSLQTAQTSPHRALRLVIRQPKSSTRFLTNFNQISIKFQKVAESEFFL